MEIYDAQKGPGIDDAMTLICGNCENPLVGPPMDLGLDGTYVTCRVCEGVNRIPD